MGKYIRRLLNKDVLIPLILLCVLGYLLFWRVQVSTARFFDVDEFSYFHWVANFARGQKPYIDFFMIFPPVFLWVFAPVVWLFGVGAKAFVAARVFSLVLFLGILGILGWIFARLRSAKYALLPVVILAFLPMPYDKFLEIRPDNLSMLAALGGIALHIKALTDRKTSSAVWLATGICYGLSLAVFPKALPIVAIGVCVAILYSLYQERVGSMFSKGLQIQKLLRLSILWIIIGISLPGFLVVLYFIALGDLSTILYSVITMPFETTNFGSIYEPHLFFFPNGSFYGGVAGFTGSLITNNALWTAGIAMGVMRMFTPFVTAGGDKGRAYAEMIVGGVFFAVVWMYVGYYPLKHSQYLIPIAIFISFYAADGIMLGIEHALRLVASKSHIYFEVGVFSLFALILVVMTAEANRFKLFWNNSLELQQIEWLSEMLPPDAKVLDMEGRVIFRDDAYYICCVPFGEFLGDVSRKPEPLIDTLERDKTPFLWHGHTGRLYSLSNDERQYIEDNYYTIVEWGDTLWIRNGVELDRIVPTN